MLSSVSGYGTTVGLAVPGAWSFWEHPAKVAAKNIIITINSINNSFKQFTSLLIIRSTQGVYYQYKLTVIKIL
jgi:hypothetical protein